MARIVRILLVVAAVLVGVGTTATSVASFTYDVAVHTRVEVPEVGWSKAQTVAPHLAREGSASSSVEARGTATTPDARSVATESASSASSGTNLGRQLASEQQMGEVGIPQSGANSQPFKPLRAADRLAETYGGNSADWSKMSSSSYTGPDGRMFETHWYENIVEGIKTEFKTKFQDSSWLGFK
jgi:hypothetical protein